MKFAKKKNDFESYEDSYEGGFYRGDEVEDDGVMEEEYAEETAEETAAPAKRAEKKDGSMLKVLAPRSYDDAPSIVGHLMDGYTVVLNIEGMERAAAMRLIDFLLGALEVLNGDFRPVTKTTLVFSPTAGKVSGEEDEEDEI